ncbi:MAG: hypothetical protein K9N40_09135 [Candidatus Cloacimonetes bacterium]|nr:hypothetical protein [Candidatus Cloacimonadota bacterium]
MKKKDAAKALVGTAAVVGVTVVCPPAGIALGILGFLKSAKKYAKTGNPQDAAGMFTNYGGVNKPTKK